MKREAPSSTLSIGSPIPKFELLATDGQSYSEEILFEKYPAGLTVVFTCNHCPYAIGWEGRLNNFSEQYSSKSYGIVAICSNDAKKYPDDSYAAMKNKDLKFLYLHDETQDVAKAFDAACTPEAFAFDSDKKLAFQGAIDDNYRDENAVSNHWLRDAIEATLEGRPPSSPTSHALGCSIKWK